ncbi:hypothetical protein HDU93_009369 [Gonapodya sp. JEL0774]|nr:hypothetical protein HDU93_009369 [Gonapodya sp. JEL0774]
MEVTSDSFEAVFPELERAILDADLVAFDTELSGLVDRKENQIDYWDSVAERVEKSRRAARAFAILQLGICTFTWQDDHYVARPFTIFTFPTTTTRSSPDRTLVFQSSSFSFLSRNNFNFNKWVAMGVPYLSLEEEHYARKRWWKEKGLPEVWEDMEAARVRALQPQRLLNGDGDGEEGATAQGATTQPTPTPAADNDPPRSKPQTQSYGPDLTPRPEDLPFLHTSLTRVSNWSGIPIDPPLTVPPSPPPSITSAPAPSPPQPPPLTDNPLSPTLIITCPTAYHRRLVHQEVRNVFSGRLKTSGAPNGVTVSRTPGELAGMGDEAGEFMKKMVQEAKEAVDGEMRAAVGVRRVLDVVARRVKEVRERGEQAVRGVNGSGTVPADIAERKIKVPRTARRATAASTSSSVPQVPALAALPASTPPPPPPTVLPPFATTGHNCLLDVCHISGKMWRDPQSGGEGAHDGGAGNEGKGGRSGLGKTKTAAGKKALEEWKGVVREVFGDLIDTKHLASHPAVRAATQGAGGTALGQIYEHVNRERGFDNGAKIVFAAGFDGYANGKEQAHEAGYDAYMTGYACIRFAECIARHARGSTEPAVVDVPSRFPSPTGPVLGSYVNKLHLMRSELGFLDLAGKDPSRPNLLYVSHFSTSWDSPAVESFLVKLGGAKPRIVKWLGEDACLATVDEKTVDKVVLEAGTVEEAKVVRWDEYEGGCMGLK